MPQQFCSITIVNYNGRSMLRGCLDSVFSQTYSPFEVILVDNASSDGSVAFVRQHYPAVRVIQSPENLGFAGGNNLGVRHAQGELVVLLNTDVVVEEGWLDALVEAVGPNDVAVASSLIKTRGIPDKYYEKNGSVNFLGHNIMCKFRKTENIFFAGGASLIFKRDLLGLPFDGDYFLYGEDVYLSLRARFLGYRVLHAARSHVSHWGSETTKRQQPALITRYQERNRLLNTLLFFRAGTILKTAPFLAVNVAAKILASILVRRYSIAGLLRAYTWLLLHPRTIARKRRSLHSAFRVQEKEIISWMTSDLMNGDSRLGLIVNKMSGWYCRLVGLKTLDQLPVGLR